MHGTRGSKTTRIAVRTCYISSASIQEYNTVKRAELQRIQLYEKALKKIDPKKKA